MYTYICIYIFLQTKHETRNTKHETRNQKCETRNRNQKPETRNQKPETQIQEYADEELEDDSKAPSISATLSPVGEEMGPRADALLQEEKAFSLETQVCISLAHTICLTERLVWYCRTTSANTALRTPRRTCCPFADVLITVPRVSRSCERFPDGFDLHLLQSVSGIHTLAWLSACRESHPSNNNDELLLTQRNLPCTINPEPVNREP